MKKILFYMIVCIWSCTSTDEQNLPNEGSPDKLPDASIIDKEQCILNAVNDKEGLRIFGQGKVYGDSTMVAWGIKNKMLWCGFFEVIEENLFEEKYIWQGNEDFIDTIKVIDLGYGRSDTLMLLPQKEPYCSACFFEKDTFGLQVPYFPAIFIENKNIYINDQIICSPWIKGYYITQKYSEYPSSERYITNCKGEKIYKIDVDAGVDKNSIPVSLEDFISVTGYKNSIYISRKEAKKKHTRWTYILNNVGHIVDDHYPTFKEEHSINNDRIAFTFYITNYDGSKNTKSIKIDIDNGNAINE